MKGPAFILSLLYISPFVASYFPKMLKTSGFSIFRLTFEGLGKGLIAYMFGKLPFGFKVHTKYCGSIVSLGYRVRSSANEPSLVLVLPPKMIESLRSIMKYNYLALSCSHPPPFFRSKVYRTGCYSRIHNIPQTVTKTSGLLQGTFPLV